MLGMDKQLWARRFLLPPVIIIAVFLFLEKTRPFTDVWKPLLLYFAVALPAFFLIDRVRARLRAQAAQASTRVIGPGDESPVRAPESATSKGNA